MEGELDAEIDFVSDNADHNQITSGHNTSCTRGGGGDGCMHSGSDARRQNPYIMQTRQPCVSKVCPLGILMSSGGSSEWYM